MDVSRRSHGRRAISGIIGAVLLFTMLFTIGTEYFLFVNSANNLETQSLVERGNALASRLQEGMTVTTSLSATNYLEFYFNNTGGATVNVTSVFVISSTGAILACDGIGLPSGQGCVNDAPVMPMVANVGKGSPPARSGYAVTGYLYPTSSSPTVTVKLFTSNGNAFSETYPETGVSLAAQALSSGAIGDLYLAFQSYHYYNVYTGSSCPNGAPYSGYCLTSKGQAFAIDHSLMSSGYDVAFSMSVTDLNQQRASIVLDPYTLMSLVPESGKGSLSYTNWFIVSNKTTGGFNAIMASYTPVVLTYDVPVTIVFASGYPLYNAVFGSGAVQSVGSSIAAGTTTPVFMVSHGCEGIGISTCSVNTANYGQNSPYVTTLFY